MIQSILEIENLDAFLVIGILVLFGTVETFSGFLVNSKRTKGDWLQEVISFFALSSMIKPFIVALIVMVGNLIAPEAVGMLKGFNLFLVMIAYLIVDDILQYWYHRTAHENQFLWKLHRAHHQAEEMGFFVSYRNAALYYLIMPNIWWIGLVVFLGGGQAVAIGLILKQMVIIGSHSRIKWDKPFYDIVVLKPLITLIERIIVTPAFHHSHHGISKLDSISDPNGNFGNMFSIWDQLFGTAKFTRAYPEKYGLQKKTNDKWTAAYLYPLVKSEDDNSELANGYNKIKTATVKPIIVHLMKEEKYLWCKCGLSKNQPYCDGSHHGTKYKPIDFTAKRDGTVKLCNCKISKSPPFCDNSHMEMEY